MAGMTLGQTIKAARLGWHRLPYPGEGLLRISDAELGWRCELHPLGIVPTETKHDYYRKWWADDERAVIDQSPFLRGLREIEKPFVVILSEEGIPIL